MPMDLGTPPHQGIASPSNLSSASKLRLSAQKDKAASRTEEEDVATFISSEEVLQQQFVSQRRRFSNLVVLQGLPIPPLPLPYMHLYPQDR